MVNRIIVDARDVGKTTFLFNKAIKLVNLGTGIIVMDSATDHEEKSLLKKINNTYDDAVIIDQRDEEKIVLDKIGLEEYISRIYDCFPFNEIIHNKDHIICFDLSYFLEKGHDVYDETQNIELYNHYRKLYNQLSEQIVIALIIMAECGIIKNKVVLMDEIELPVTDYDDIYSLQDGISFVASVHPENAFGSFYKQFEEEDFKPYVKKKG